MRKSPRPSGKKETLEAEVTAGDAKRQRVEESLAEIELPRDGAADRGSGNPPARSQANSVLKRLPGARADAMEVEPHAWTEQADEAMAEDGLKTKRMRTCGLEVNEDTDEEGARPEESELATDAMT